MRPLLFGLALGLATTTSTLLLADTHPSRTVFLQSNGKLGYTALPRGDRIMDFSSAGYLGGGVKIPMIPVVQTLFPSGKDDSASIQSAVDDLARRPLDHGFRGTLLLKAGIYNCPNPITIKASGIILRGEGVTPKGTTLKMTGKAHAAVVVTSAGKPKAEGPPVKLTDDYIPSGSITFTVASASGFKAGDPVWILRPVTDQWIHFMGMDTLVRNGKPEHWISGDIRTERAIKSIDGNKITLDVPLTDNFDSDYVPGASMTKYSDKERLAQVGLENFRITAPLYNAIRIDNTADSWVRSVEILDTTNSVSVGNDTARITLDDVGITHTVATTGSAKPADFAVEGTQILINKCRDQGDSVFYFVTGPKVTGPIVLLNCTFKGHGWIQPHQRWATGLLLDNCNVPEGGIELIDRGIMGSGHGWTIGWSLAWNCSAKSFEIERPPGSMNWAIGCRGTIDKSNEEPGNKTKLDPGGYESQNIPVSPSSLYLAQLAERAGKEAVKNIGY